MVNKNEACKLFSKLIQIGKIYDPNVRMDALNQLEALLSDSKIMPNVINLTLKDIRSMLELFKGNKTKNIILLVDTHKDTDEINMKKVNYLIEIFDGMEDNDKLSLVTINRKVNVIYSLSEKNKNTVQLRNQLKNIQWDSTHRCNYVKGIITSINELIEYDDEKGTNISKNIDRHILCITSSHDLKSFHKYSREEMLLIQNSMEKHKIKFLTFVPFENNERFDAIVKYLQFLTKDYVLLENPPISEVKEVIKSISNVKLLNEKLIFERFE